MLLQQILFSDDQQNNMRMTVTCFSKYEDRLKIWPHDFIFYRLLDHLDDS